MTYTSESINEVAAALSKAQGMMDSAVKNKMNPHFKSKYADLDAIWDACRGPLSTNSLSVCQTFEMKEGVQLPFMVTKLLHASGQWIKSEMPVITTKCDPQGIGSAITYYKRYTLAAILGITMDEDDDGNEAQKGSHDHKPYPAKINGDMPKATDKQIGFLKGMLKNDLPYGEYVMRTLKEEHSIESLEAVPIDLMKTIIEETKKRAEAREKAKE